MTKFTGYQQAISAATGVNDPDKLTEIEEIMRQESGGVLDHLDRQAFNRLARSSKLLMASPDIDTAHDEQTAREALPFKLFG